MAARRAALQEPLIRLGSPYGGWWIPSDGLAADSVVYSFGVGEDTTFDEALIDRFGCDVHAFDPTPRAIIHAAGVQDTRLHFHSYGLWVEDGPLELFAPADVRNVSHSVIDRAGQGRSFTAECLTLETIMQQLGHDHVDLIKMDIEGAEATVIDSWPDGGRWPQILAVEVESPEAVRKTMRRLRSLEGHGYHLAHVEGRNWLLTRRAAQTDDRTRDVG